MTKLRKMQHAIFIFTKERPSSLEKSIEKIDISKYITYIIDDSYTSESIEQNKKIVNSMTGTAYLGKDEFKTFYKESSDIDFGSSNWNLGNSRNFALDYAKANDYDKVLFCDDDITVLQQEDYDFGFTILKDNFISYNILGMTDDSIIGHISSALNIVDNEKFLSGGFLFFEPKKIKHRFLNIYNEDWILQMVENDKKIHLAKKVVYHATFDPYENYKEKILFQEYGEIFVSGLFKKELDIETSNEFFWKSIIEERKKDINTLEKLAKEHKQHKFLEIVTYLKLNYNLYQPIFFKKLYIKLKS